MKNIFLIFITFGILAGFSCEQYEETDFTFDGTTKSLLENKLGQQVRLYYEVVVKADKLDLLEGSTTYTHLVPQNEAVQAALEGAGFNTVEEASVEFCASFVDNHTIEGFNNSGALENGTITNEAGNTIYVSVGDNGVFFNGRAEVTTADEASTNGIVHIINFPLNQFPENSIAEIVTASATADTLAEFTILLAALQATGLDAALASGEFTVFAPTDEAFVEFGIADAADVANVDVDVLTEILQYHVLAGRNFTVDLASRRYFTLAGTAEDGQRGIDIEAGNPIVFDDQAGTSSVAVNLLATNGAVHVVDNVILPRPYVVDAFDGTFNISGVGFDGVLMGAFYNGITSSTLELDSLFRTEDTLSIMVPRFFDASIATEETYLNHVFEGLLDISSFEGGNKITSVNGSEYFVTQTAGGNSIINGRSAIQTFTDGSTIIEDYSTYNGFITNFFDTFTPLPEIDVDSVLTDSTNYSLFNAAIKFFEKGSISGATYLAVHDSTFVDVLTEFEVPSNDVDSLEFTEDLAGLEEAINAHIISEVFFASDLGPGATYTDLNGDELVVVELNTGGDTSFGIQINDDGVLSTISFGPTLDVLANNGAIHVVSDIIPIF